MNQPILQVQQNIEDEKAIDLTKYLGFFSDNRWLILSVAFVVTLLGFAYALVATPIYRANILIKVEDGSARPRNMPGDLSAPDATQDIKTAVASEMEVLRSRAVVSRAVDSGRFYIQVEPKYFPGFGAWMARRNKGLSDPGILGYGGYAWGTEQAKVSVFNVPEALEGQPFVLVAEEGGAYSLKHEEQEIEIRGRVGEVLKTPIGDGEIELLVDQLHANPGAHFALTRSPRLETIERLQEALNISERGKQSGIIDVSLEGPNAKHTTAVLNEIGREYIRQNVDTKTEEAEKTLAFLNTQLPELKQELEKAESKYNQLRNTRGTVDLGEEAKSVLQQSLGTQTRMLELKQKREELLTRFQPEHPSVQAIDQQMRELRRELSSVDSKIKKLPDVEQNVLRLSRDVKINTELYTALLSAAQQLRLATESNIGTVRLLDKAVTPIKPVKPKRTILVVLSSLVGLVLGVIVAFARKMVYGRIDAPHEVEQLLGLPVTATIPHSPSQALLDARPQSDKKAASMLPLDVPSDGTVESLRRFRTSLQFAMLEAKNNIVMIAGPTPGVGKSFVSANFAAVLASIGKKVLLIDGDLRSGHLHRYFGLDRRAGLADVITGKVMFGQAIQKGVAENVDFLSTGELPRKPAELLAHENFGKLLELLSTRYDYILIDTAPVLAVSDALAVASHAGAIFNVVRGGISTAGEIEEAVKRLNQAGHTVTGVVFNDAKQRATRYEYGGAYGRYAEAAGRA
ncbi:polysaccharide biosynthesis tyrosine autokinase [Noviherbaspirillum agri]